jgi:hypothetical protein
VATGLFLYLVVVEVGVNAGKIHYGVSVDGVDVGGMTASAAYSLLKERAAELRTTQVEFHRNGVSVTFTPEEISWRPRLADTVREAYGAGRQGGLLRGALVRVEAWTSGVKLPWLDRRSGPRIGEMLDEWQKELNAAGTDLPIDRQRARSKIRRALKYWPKTSYRIPLEKA